MRKELPVDIELVSEIVTELITENLDEVSPVIEDTIRNYEYEYVETMNLSMKTTIGITNCTMLHS